MCLKKFDYQHFVDFNKSNSNPITQLWLLYWPVYIWTSRKHHLQFIMNSDKESNNEVNSKEYDRSRCQSHNTPSSRVGIPVEQLRKIFDSSESEDNEDEVGEPESSSTPPLHRTLSIGQRLPVPEAVPEAVPKAEHKSSIIIMLPPIRLPVSASVPKMKPRYTCTVCGKSYATKSNVTRHRKSFAMKSCLKNYHKSTCFKNLPSIQTNTPPNMSPSYGLSKIQSSSLPALESSLLDPSSVVDLTSNDRTARFKQQLEVSNIGVPDTHKDSANDTDVLVIDENNQYC